MVWVLKQAIPGTGLNRATPITYEALSNGRAVAKRCRKELAELYKKTLAGERLAASLKPAR